MSPPNAADFTWKANITAQTEVAFSMIDSRGRSGGTDIMRRVQPSGDKSCILSSGGGDSGTGTGSNPSNNNDDDRGGQKLLSVGAIAGIAVGGAVIACILMGIIWCLMRRRSKSKRARPLDLSDDFSRNTQTSQTQNNLPQQYAPVPYPGPGVLMAPGANAPSASFLPDRLGQHTPSASLSATSPPQSQYSGEGPSSSSGQTASSSRRFIVHRDIEEGDEPVDLPPEYSDRRAPIQGLAETSSAPSHGGKTKKG